jgi:hypothetical protein
MEATFRAGTERKRASGAWSLALALVVPSLGCSNERASLGDPIVVSPEDLETWVWVDIPEMRCSDGSPSGVVVNFTDRSDDVLVYFQGGGACWSGITCAVQGAELAPLQPDPLAQFMSDSEHAQSGLFDRDDPTNPTRDYDFVFIPYCTGDGHIGNEVADYGTFGTIHHVGYANVTAALERIVPTVAGSSTVVIAGFSAGGIGATGNYHQLAAAFESVGVGPTALINDAGPILAAPYLSTNAQATLRDAWGLEETIGAWCPTCLSDGLHEVYRRQAELHPGMRGALVCSYEDSVVRLMYAALLSPIEGGDLAEGLVDLAHLRDDAADAVSPSLLREFYYDGDRHGATSQLPLGDTPGLAEFLTIQIEGEGEWTSVRPQP